MSWVDDNLATGETVRHRFKHRWTGLIHWRFLIPIFGQIGLLRTAVRIARSEAVVTSHRLIHVDQGLIGREIFEINLAFIEGMAVKQGIFDRIANQGTVAIGSGSGSRDIEFYRVPDPMEFRRQALAAIDARQS